MFLTGGTEHSKFYKVVKNTNTKKHYFTN